MALDDVVKTTLTGPRVEEAMYRTLRWIDRCIEGIQIYLTIHIHPPSFMPLFFPTEICLFVLRTHGYVIRLCTSPVQRCGCILKACTFA